MENDKKTNPDSELKDLIDGAKSELPGVIDLLQAYGDYEETVLLMQQYLGIAEYEPFMISSNQSD